MVVYQRHNFHFNFNNAIATNDKGMAMDILANELNELIIDNTAGIKKLLSDNGIELSGKDTHADLAVLMADALKTNVKLQQGLCSLIMQRHENPTVSADAGIFDQLYPNVFHNTDGSVNTTASIPEQLCAGIGGISQAEKLKQTILDSLEAKLKLRGISVPVSAMQIGKIIAGVAIAAGIIFIIVKIFKTDGSNEGQPSIPTS